jgi:tetratricopeptide (TPR) repeat protein
MVRVAAVMVVLCALGRSAHADARAQADQLFEAGRADYAASRFQSAIALFEQAYELVNDPAYLFNIAQAYRNAADCANAFEYYRRYLTELPAAHNADSVRAWLRELQPCAEQRREEAERARRAEAELARVQAVPSSPVPVGDQVAGTTTVVHDRGATLRTAGLAVGTAGAAGLMVGVVYGVKGQAHEDAIALACARGCQWDDVAERDAAGRRANTISTLGYVAGGLGVAAGVALYVAGRMRIEQVVVAPAAGGVTVGAHLRF